MRTVAGQTQAAARAHQEPTAEEHKRLGCSSVIPSEAVTSTGCELPSWMRQLCVVGAADRDEVVESAKIVEKSPSGGAVRGGLAHGQEVLQKAREAWGT